MSHRRPSLTAAWDSEWERLLRSRSARTRPAAWAAAHPRLTPYADLEAVLHASGRGLPDDEADEVLAAVVERAAPTTSPPIS